MGTQQSEKGRGRMRGSAMSVRVSSSSSSSVVFVVLVCRLLSQLFVLCGVVLSSNFKIWVAKMPFFNYTLNSLIVRISLLICRSSTCRLIGLMANPNIIWIKKQSIKDQLNSTSDQRCWIKAQFILFFLILVIELAKLNFSWTRVN